jgi:hypothetical protein
MLSPNSFILESLVREKNPEKEILPFLTADRQARSAPSGALIGRSGIA